MDLDEFTKCFCSIIYPTNICVATVVFAKAKEVKISLRCSKLPTDKII